MGAIPAQVLTNLHELTQHSALRMTRVVAYCTPANKRSTSENKGAKLWLIAHQQTKELNRRVLLSSSLCRCHRRGG